MVTLTAPNGVEVRVPDEQADRLVGLGYSRAEAGKPEPKAAPRRRAAKPKE